MAKAKKQPTAKELQDAIHEGHINGMRLLAVAYCNSPTIRNHREHIVGFVSGLIKSGYNMPMIISVYRDAYQRRSEFTEKMQGVGITGALCILEAISGEFDRQMAEKKLTQKKPQK